MKNKSKYFFLLLILAIFLFIFIYTLTQSRSGNKPFKSESTITSAITQPPNNLLGLNIPELEINDNVIKPKGDNKEDFTIFVNPPPRGYDPSLVVKEEEIDFSNLKYKKLTLFNRDNKLLDIILSPSTEANKISFEIVTKIDKEEIALDYIPKILKAYSNNFTFTPEELEDYYQVYRNPYVIHIRKVLNSYLEGKNEGISSPNIVVKTNVDKDGFMTGLDSFSKDYYKSKFVVLSINDFLAGGKEIQLIFQDKPDKLFGVWVYKLAGDTETFDLRGFWQNPKITGEKLNQLNEQYKMFLEDKEHAL